MKKPVFFAAAILFLLVASPAGSNGSEEAPRITDLSLRQGEENVLLSATLLARFDEKAREALRGGVPFRFEYRIRLTKKGSIFGEKIIRDRELPCKLEFDPVRKVYLFTTEGQGSKVAERTTRDEEEAFRWLTRIVDWPLYPLEKLERNTRYRVRIMATLRSVELPSVLGYLFFFTTVFNRETPWVQVDFTY